MDMDCDELLLGGVKAVTARCCRAHPHASRGVGTRVTFECVGGRLVRCMALSPLSREINA